MCKERPILFSGPMVRAILEGRKTQTRRAAKLSENGHLIVERKRHATYCVDLVDGSPMWRPHGGSPLISYPQEKIEEACPYGRPGDRLWVRETWGLHDTDPKDVPANAHIYYRASDENRNELRYQLWRPSIFMPRWASRITLEITGVRVERVQDISVDDCEAEGIDLENEHADDFSYAEWIGAAGGSCGCKYPEIYPFMILWNSINAKRGFGWDKNPWVWALRFKVIKPSIKEPRAS